MKHDDLAATQRNLAQRQNLRPLMGRKFSRKCLCLAVCGDPAAQLSQAPTRQAALALASFWNVPSLKQIEHLASINCSGKHQRNTGTFFLEIILTVNTNLHSEGC